jgi:hypothetical protein
MDEVSEGVVEGYLLLADISGYTEFLTGTELEHSHAIVTELTRQIRVPLHNHAPRACSTLSESGTSDRSICASDPRDNDWPDR